MLPLTIVDTSFAKAWERAVKTVLKFGDPLSFGGGSEIKTAIDSQINFALDKNAVQEILQLKHHPSDPFATEGRMSEYIKEYQKDFDADTFDYTYRNRLEKGFAVTDYESGTINNLNQLELLRKGLESQREQQLSSNRNVAVLYNPSIDYNRATTPCWNHVLVRYLKDDYVSFYYLFRSHDLFTAWEPNMMAITNMLNEEVAKPNGCKIQSIFEFNYSLHIYSYDTEQAANIKTVPRNPMLSARQHSLNEFNVIGSF